MPLKKSVKDLAEDARSRVEEISPERLRRDLASEERDRPIVIDVREPEEWTEGTIEGARRVPRGVLEGAIESAVFGRTVTDADLDRPIVCYCRSGVRSLFAADRLREMGFRRAMSLRGGYRAWSEGG